MKTDAIMDALRCAYDVAVDGLPGAPNAQELADEYLKEHREPHAAADSLILWQAIKGGSSGLVTGALGLPAAPAALLASTYIQLRTVAAIAHVGGHDVSSDRVRTLGLLCLCGDGASSVLKNAGVEVGTKLCVAAVKSISGEALKQINKAVGFRLVTKFGTTGVVNLGKAVPIVGALIGGSLDAMSVYAAGEVAKRIFLRRTST